MNLPPDNIPDEPKMTINAAVDLLDQMLLHLENGRYTALSTMLDTVTPSASGTAHQSHILAAAREICAACEQATTDARALRRAYESAVTREAELQEQLQTLLQIALTGHSGHAEDLPPRAEDTPAAETEKLRDGLWQRVQRLFETNSEVLGLLPHAGRGLRQTRGAAADQPPDAGPVRAVESGPPLTVYAFGMLRVYVRNRRIDNWYGNKSKSIFKYLLLHGGPVHHEVLMDTFWPDEDPEAARRNLYQAVYLLRQALQGETEDAAYVLCQNGTYLLSPDLEIWVDSEQFQAHYRDGKRHAAAGRLEDALREFEAADNLYGGDFLAEDRYEDWPAEMREDLRHMRLEMINWLARHFFQVERYGNAITHARKILQMDSCREDAHRLLMRAYLAQGQRHLAIRQYWQCVEALRTELDAEPMPATVALYEEVGGDGR